MTLMIGSVLPLRDRIYARVVTDERDPDVDYDRIMGEFVALPHGSVGELVQILGGGSGAPYMQTGVFVRCDGSYEGIVYMGGEVQDAPEEIQESGVWVVGQLQDGFRAVAQDPDAVDVEEVLGGIWAEWESEGTVAGLPPLSMIEVHGPVVPHMTSSGSVIMERYIVVIGEDGEPIYQGMEPVQAPAEEEDGGGDDGGRKAGSPGEALRRLLARIAAGKDLEDAERRWRGSRWRSPCPRPGSCR